MTALSGQPSRGGSLLVVGGGLIVLGLVALALTYADIDPSQWLAGSGWTLFIIVPGVVLLVGSLVPDHQAAAGFTMAGAILTTIGLMLLVMDRTEAWESWAYAWAFIPAAAGAGLVLHGLRTGQNSAVSAGVRLAGVALALFVVGAWYFETLFSTGEPPVDLGDAWPVVLIGIGLIVLLLGLLGRPRDAQEPAG